MDGLPAGMTGGAIAGETSDLLVLRDSRKEPTWARSTPLPFSQFGNCSRPDRLVLGFAAFPEKREEFSASGMSTGTGCVHMPISGCVLRVPLVVIRQRLSRSGCNGLKTGVLATAEVLVWSHTRVGVCGLGPRLGGAETSASPIGVGLTMPEAWKRAWVAVMSNLERVG